MSNNNQNDYQTSLLGMSGLKLNMTPLPKNNMTTREILEHRLKNYNDDMELITPLPEPEAEFDGSSFSVQRNGINQANWPARAGLSGYQNRASTSIPNKGPTPEGSYIINPKKLQSNNGFLWDFLKDTAGKITGKNDLSFKNIYNKNFWKIYSSGWGNYRIPLEPTDNTKTFGRNQMYIHGGNELGSAGCIDLGPNMDKFAPYIKSAKKPIKVRVKYKNENF